MQTQKNIIAQADVNHGPGKPIRPTKLAHIVLRSGERFEEMAEWYRNLLNAEITHKDAMAAFMTYDDEHHRIAVVKVAGVVARPYDSVGLEHLAFTYGSLADLLATYERLRKNGCMPIITINHGATTSIYYEDPDRNRVELQVDNFANFEEFMVFAKSGKLARNPIGVSFNADEMLASLRAGVPAETLQAYPAEGADMEPHILARLQRN